MKTPHFLREKAQVVTKIVPGMSTALIIALAATFMTEHYGGPQLIYALFFGIAFNFLADDPKTKAGIDFAARSLLRFGVAMLGARIAFSQLASLGGAAIAVVAVGVVATIFLGVWLSHRYQDHWHRGVLSGGAVAICGASAALAISAILPRHEQAHRYTILTVVGVTTLSTMSMIFYPALAVFLQLTPVESGIFLGGSIHDVAQVVGAGYTLSPEIGDYATLVKLFRVSMLVPVVFVLTLLFRQARAAENQVQGERPPLVPLFLLAFLVLATMNSFGLFSVGLVSGLSSLSRWCLVIAIAALGVKTSFKQLAELGWVPVLIMVAETAFIALWVLLGIVVLRYVG